MISAIIPPARGRAAALEALRLIGGTDGPTYSCGMQLLSEPDVEVDTADADEAAAVGEPFALFLLFDRPGDRLQAGHTFAPSADAPRYTLARTACARYQADHLFFNPLGYWRLAPRVAAR